jgi:hypothetical protein
LIRRLGRGPVLPRVSNARLARARLTGQVRTGRCRRCSYRAARGPIVAAHPDPSGRRQMRRQRPGHFQDASICRHASSSSQRRSSLSTWSCDNPQLRRGVVSSIPVDHVSDTAIFTPVRPSVKPRSLKTHRKCRDSRTCDSNRNTGTAAYWNIGRTGASTRHSIIPSFR